MGARAGVTSECDFSHGRLWKPVERPASSADFNICRCRQLGSRPCRKRKDGAPAVWLYPHEVKGRANFSPKNAKGWGTRLHFPLFTSDKHLDSDGDETDTRDDAHKTP
jgi:hypothetical protein